MKANLRYLCVIFACTSCWTTVCKELTRPGIHSSYEDSRFPENVKSRETGTHPANSPPLTQLQCIMNTGSTPFVSISIVRQVRALLEWQRSVSNKLLQIWSDMSAKVIKALQSLLYCTNISFSSGGGSVIAEHDEARTIMTWAGRSVTVHDLQAVKLLRHKLRHSHREHSTLKDVELLRFLRGQRGEIEPTLAALRLHLSWRAQLRHSRIKLHDSPLKQEIFWLGINANNCAVLVLRTQVHDGSYYNEDPVLFTRYLVEVLEEGRRLYGVGTERQVCLLMDRGGAVKRNGVPKVEVRDMAVLPRIVELVNNVVSTVQAHYPEVLHSAKIAPASWFFSMCYRLVSSALDPATRAKFEFIGPDELASKLHEFVPVALLPRHLGGPDVAYQSEVNVVFNGAGVGSISTKNINTTSSPLVVI